MSGPFGSSQFMYATGAAEEGQSLRFEDGDSAYLSRTPTTAGNRKKFTISAWVKRAKLSSGQDLIMQVGTESGGNQRAWFYFTSSDTLTFMFGNSANNTTGYEYYTNAKFRDPSAWYHVVAVIDTDNTNEYNSTAGTNRIEIYVNGEFQTLVRYRSAVPSGYANGRINQNIEHRIGAGVPYGGYSDFYLANYTFLDGQALDPTSFGEYDDTLWKPKSDTAIQSLTFGTNGFYLPFKQTTEAEGFSTVTYTGTSAEHHVEGVGFEPDLVWIKSRTSAESHWLYDSVRGVDEGLKSNATSAENSNLGGLEAFESSGFELGTYDGVNDDGYNYVAWCFEAGGPTFSDTSTLYSNASAGGTSYPGETLTWNVPTTGTYRFEYFGGGQNGGSSGFTGVSQSGTLFNWGTHNLKVNGTSQFTFQGGYYTNSGQYYTRQRASSDGNEYLSLTAGDVVTFEVTAGGSSNLGGNYYNGYLGKPLINIYGDINSDGTINSQVSANTAKGFSIVSYIGTGANATVGHGLSSAPEIIIPKNRDYASGTHWDIYASPIGAGNILRLNSTLASTASAPNWNSTAPTSSVFTVGTSNSTNRSGDGYIAYCFHSVSGYSSIGSYTGTGASGNTVNCGFRPAFLMYKNTTTAEQWAIVDSTREPSGTLDNNLYANASTAEDTNSIHDVEFTSTGFTLNGTHALQNASGDTYIYMAFADTRDATFFGDTSGNGNNWTPNALNNTDVVPDSPVTGGNFATWNPIEDDTKFATSSQGLMALSEGNLKYSGTRNVFSTFSVTSGKYYWEIYNSSSTTTSTALVGVLTQDARGSIYGVYYNAVNGNKGLGTLNTGATESTYGATFTDGDIIGVALNMDDDEVTFYKNGSSQGVISASSLSGKPVSAWVQNGGNTGTMVGIANFGQDSSFAGNETPQGNTDDNGVGDFYYAPPSGYLALTTGNLDTPAITAPDDYFNTVLYTGNGSSQSITGVGFQPSWLWIKSRSNAFNHFLQDEVRGAGKTINSDLTNAENTNWTGLSFDSDGFTVDTAYSSEMNTSSATYVAWNWLASNSTSSNTDGSITSTVSANQTSGFSIVSYVADGTNTSTVGHGLSTEPKMVIQKNRSAASDWLVYTDLVDGSDDYLLLNSNAGKGNAAGGATATVFNSWDRTSGNNMIAYCFAEVEGYSKIGSYTGTGGSSGDGAFVHCGFRPSWVMIKWATGGSGHGGTGNWIIKDNKRLGYNPTGSTIEANLAATERASTHLAVDLVSNGFRIRTGASDDVNSSGGTYIFLAFAEAPFKSANAR